eukprot:TRINITY_DN27599_c0_g1_i1.p1 TRINITY_DN27599_c0_g1~~TRINITY_DN27599_c0_g1_i1.p1  ORF type:complete len:665 (+),score=134.83 TRINITY_DN27599_c0_g1_i1:135-2129(+)
MDAAGVRYYDMLTPRIKDISPLEVSEGDDITVMLGRVALDESLNVRQIKAWLGDEPCTVVSSRCDGHVGACHAGPGNDWQVVCQPRRALVGLREVSVRVGGQGYAVKAETDVITTVTVVPGAANIVAAGSDPAAGSYLGGTPVAVSAWGMQGGETCHMVTVGDRPMLEMSSLEPDARNVAVKDLIEAAKSNFGTIDRIYAEFMNKAITGLMQVKEIIVYSCDWWVDKGFVGATWFYNGIEVVVNDTGYAYERVSEAASFTSVALDKAIETQRRAQHFYDHSPAWCREEPYTCDLYLEANITLQAELLQREANETLGHLHANMSYRHEAFGHLFQLVAQAQDEAALAYELTRDAQAELLAATPTHADRAAMTVKFANEKVQQMARTTSTAYRHWAQAKDVLDNANDLSELSYEASVVSRVDIEGDDAELAELDRVADESMAKAWANVKKLFASGTQAADLAFEALKNSEKAGDLMRQASSLMEAAYTSALAAAQISVPRRFAEASVAGAEDFVAGRVRVMAEDMLPPRAPAGSIAEQICDAATVIADPFARLTVQSDGDGGVEICDNTLNGWYYFPRGGRMVEAPPGGKHFCGTESPGYLTAVHPPLPGSRAEIKVCFDGDSTCQWSTKITVFNCGSSKFVYNLRGTPAKEGAGLLARRSIFRSI